MKLPIRSMRVPSNRSRDRLRFFGKNTLLSVHETGLTLEGYVPNVTYPLFMSIIARAVSDWTIRTIPFSRIRKCQVVERRRIRSLATIALGLWLAYMLSSLWGNPIVLILIVSTASFLIYQIGRWLFPDCIDLVYEQRNARPCAFRIRFTKRGDERLLFEELHKHRLEVAAPTLAKVASEVTHRKSWWRSIGRRKDTE